MKKWFGQVLACVLAILLLAGGLFGLQNLTALAPDNPINDRLEDYQIKPSQAVTVSLSETALSLAQPGVNEAESQQTSDADRLSDLSQNALDDMAEGMEDGRLPGTGGGHSTGLGDEYGVGTDKEYFSTTIKDGEVVTSTDYSFSIKHNFPELKVVEENIFVNGELQIQFNGNVKLKEGDNSIRIVVIYDEPGGRQIKASKKYSVPVNTSGIVITHTLQNGTVEKAVFVFDASASYAGQEIPLEVAHDNNRLSGDGTYVTRLTEGKNIIYLRAEADGKVEERTFEITYKIPDGLSIYTDLYNRTVYDETFSFQAKLLNGSSEAKFSVTVNGRPVTGTDGNYTVTLKARNNEIVLVGSDPGQKRITEKYNIRFIRQYTPPDKEPTITTNIYDGMQVKGTQFILTVYAQDWQGNRIYVNGQSVDREGYPVSYDDETDEHTIYKVSLVPGPNTINITAMDSDEYAKRVSYTIYCEEIATGTPMGNVSISLEASTVGLGTLVSGTVPIYYGEPASYPILRFLSANGYQYNISGSPDYSMHLNYILRDGLPHGYQIPQDLLDTLVADGVNFTNAYTEGGLGNYDFTSGAGWMYSVNGTYANTSMSNYHLNDGDQVRLRFTLAWGRDIGGNNSGSGSNYYKEW